MKKFICLLLMVFFIQNGFSQTNQPFIVILGITQDGGYPQMGCTKQCCASAWANDSLQRYVVSFALMDSQAKKWWLFEATPDIKYQLQLFWKLTKEHYNYLPDGIFITHAHIGHYTGLMQLGKEVMNTKDVPVYVLPRMAAFLENNGPWSQLVKLKNIDIHQMKADSAFSLTPSIQINPFTVPHRDEYSETAGFKITAGNKKILFIPDIDKWEKWDRNIIAEVKSVDIALVDGTFFSGDELPGRNMDEVPHPTVTHTMDLFKNEDTATKAKIYFIHCNHTNPLIWDSATKEKVKSMGFNYAKQGEVL